MYNLISTFTLHGGPGEKAAVKEGGQGGGPGGGPGGDTRDVAVLLESNDWLSNLQCNNITNQ